MKTRHILPLAGLGLLGAAILAGLALTRTPGAGPAPVLVQAKERLVDEGPLKTARHLGPLAETQAERDLAHQAERVATHEVDLAFADALRQASEAPPNLTPATRELLAKRDAAAAAVAEHKQRIEALTRRMEAAAGPAREALADPLEMAKAELGLDNDELEQTSEDLERAGADPQARIRRLKAAHQAAETMAAAPWVPPSRFYQPGSGLAKFARLAELRTKLDRLRQARQESFDKGQRMIRRRAEFALEVAAHGEDRQAVKRDAARVSHPGQAEPGVSRATALATLKALEHHMSDQRRLADSGRRIQDAWELDEVYGAWIALEEAELRVALHAVLVWALWVLVVILAVLVADRAFQRHFTRIMAGENRVGRILKVVKFATQALGALIILILAVGLPSQLTTLFGLAGAGLTVALKDFIMAFFGWFILVGRNGIHVGDWVEIQGVGGEVVEIGLLRTFLMETGSWTDANHPTGRIVSFVNSFAMDKHFFNFSTSSKWMWDELQFRVPQGQDPYPFIDAIRVLVTEATAANATLARQEWSQASRQGRATFETQPSLDVTPTLEGTEVRIRYLTRATERHATQRALNQALLELLHGKRS